MNLTTKRLRTLAAGRITLLLIILAALVSPAPVQAVSTIAAPGDPVTLDLTSLPSAQGWTFLHGDSNVPETSVYFLDGVHLHMDTIGAGWSGFAYLLPDAVDPARPFTLTVRARVTAYEEQNPDLDNPHGFDLIVNTGSEQYEVGISPKRIFAGDPNGQYISVTRDVAQFHDYRIESMGGGSFEVFQDNVSLGIASARPSDAPNSLYFGDGTAGANARADISSYSFKQGLDYRLPFTSGPSAITLAPGCGSHIAANNQEEAIDYGLANRTVVVATERGTVVYADWWEKDHSRVYGKTVQIRHPDGSISFYGHLSWIAVDVGDTVTRGQNIGRSGNTGHAKPIKGGGGYHLHFEIRIGATAQTPTGHFDGGTGLNIRELPTTVWTATGCTKAQGVPYGDPYYGYAIGTP